jgi:putative flippase GtrA
MVRRSVPDRFNWLLLSSAARPLRFAGTGGTAGAVQLLLLAAFIHASWNAIAANAVAFLLAAQLNFAISITVTWRDRQPRHSFARRWLLFHASISLMAVINMLTYISARAVLPTLMASVAGIAVAAVGNYLAGDRIVFRARPGRRYHESSHRSSGPPWQFDLHA